MIVNMIFIKETMIIMSIIELFELSGNRLSKWNYGKNEKLPYTKSLIQVQYFCTTKQQCVGTPSICKSYQTNYSWIRISNYNTNVMVQLIIVFDVLPWVYGKLCGETNVTS